MKPSPREMLDTMLGHLGFVFEIKEYETPNGLTLQIYSADKDRIIGRRGEVLEDFQTLLNRMVQAQNPQGPRVMVDCEHWREIKDDGLMQRVRQLGELVRKTGRPYHLDPMNSYQRRLVHNLFKDDIEVQSWSPPDDAKLKRITLRPRKSEAS